MSMPGTSPLRGGRNSMFGCNLDVQYTDQAAIVKKPGSVHRVSGDWCGTC